MEATKTEISQKDLLRFESLGDNCEFGLVLRYLGSENSGIFRWALTNVSATTDAIETDFECLYERRNIVPHSKIMIRDLASGIAYHSELKSTESSDGLKFLISGREWDALYDKEFEKFQHLKAKFARRLDDPETIFVVKSNKGIEPSAVSKLHQALSLKAGRNVNLLHVQMRRDGSAKVLNKVSPHIAVGYVDRFAPYLNAEDSLKGQWQDVMKAALDNFTE